MRRLEECPDFKGGPPIDEILNYINEPKPPPNSCYQSVSQVQIPESKGNKKIKKKCSKEPIGQNPALNFCGGSANLSYAKEPIKNEMVKEFIGDPKVDPAGHNCNDDVFILNDTICNNANDFSTKVFENGSREESEIDFCGLDSHLDMMISNNLYHDHNSVRNKKLLNGSLNGFCFSSNDSADAACTDQNTEEHFIIKSQESFESCQSSLQSSLSSISSSLSSGKADNQEDIKAISIAHQDVLSYLHKSLPADNSKGAKLDVLSSFDEDEVCLPSNSIREIVDGKNIPIGLLIHPQSITRQDELSSLMMDPSDLLECKKAKDSPTMTVPTSSRFEDFLVTKNNFVNMDSKGNHLLASPTSAFQSCKENLCESAHVSHNVVSSWCSNLSSSHSDLKRFEKCHLELGNRQFRAPVEFVNCTVEELSSHNNLGISFGFGLEGLLEKSALPGSEIVNLSSNPGISEGMSAICSSVNLSLKPSYVANTCLSSMVSFKWSSLSSSPMNSNPKMNADTSSTFANVQLTSSLNNGSPSGCRYEYNSIKAVNFNIQDSSCKSVWKEVKSQQNLVNSSNVLASNSITLPSFYDQKLHASLDMPIRNGFVKNNLSIVHHTSKKADATRPICSDRPSGTSSRMDELDNCFLPPILDISTHKSTFNLKAAQKFLYESYKETLLQSQDKGLFKNSKNKSSRLCENRSCQKTSKPVITTT